ncbi:hypothetical protein PR048_013929 [Dryococelus australis]|uniref:Uncharacterized protein n=1 Tax=Dryococelus australis TaxID=614101 RepID=A0ABQ9HTQ5_9NEOP|nr:hypothetical protein PR048_013929 [Dryococelus australis]
MPHRSKSAGVSLQESVCRSRLAGIKCMNSCMPEEDASHRRCEIQYVMHDYAYLQQLATNYMENNAVTVPSHSLAGDEGTRLTKYYDNGHMQFLQGDMMKDHIMNCKDSYFESQQVMRRIPFLALTGIVSIVDYDEAFNANSGMKELQDVMESVCVECEDDHEDSTDGNYYDDIVTEVYDEKNDKSEDDSLEVRTHLTNEDRDGAVASALASQHGDPGSRPHVGYRAGRCRLTAGFLGVIPFSLPLHTSATPSKRVSFHVTFRDDGHLRVPAGKPVTRRQEISNKAHEQDAWCARVSALRRNNHVHLKTRRREVDSRQCACDRKRKERTKEQGAQRGNTRRKRIARTPARRRTSTPTAPEIRKRQLAAPRMHQSSERLNHIPFLGHICVAGCSQAARQAHSISSRRISRSLLEKMALNERSEEILVAARPDPSWQQHRALLRRDKEKPRPAGAQDAEEWMTKVVTKEGKRWRNPSRIIQRTTKAELTKFKFVNLVSLCIETNTRKMFKGPTENVSSNIGWSSLFYRNGVWQIGTRNPGSESDLTITHIGSVNHLSHHIGCSLPLWMYLRLLLENYLEDNAVTVPSPLVKVAALVGKREQPIRDTMKEHIEICKGSSTGSQQVMSPIPPTASMGTLSAGDYGGAVNANDGMRNLQYLGLIETVCAECTHAIRSCEVDELQNKQLSALNTDDGHVARAKESKLHIYGHAGSDSVVDNDYDDHDNAEEYDNSLDSPTQLTNEFPSTSDAKTGAKCVSGLRPLRIKGMGIHARSHAFSAKWIGQPWPAIGAMTTSRSIPIAETIVYKGGGGKTHRGTVKHLPTGKKTCVSNTENATGNSRVGGACGRMRGAHAPLRWKLLSIFLSRLPAQQYRPQHLNAGPPPPLILVECVKNFGSSVMAPTPSSQCLGVRQRTSIIYSTTQSNYSFSRPRTDVCDLCAECTVKLNLRPNDTCRAEYSDCTSPKPAFQCEETNEWHTKFSKTMDRSVGATITFFVRGHLRLDSCNTMQATEVVRKSYCRVAILECDKHEGGKMPTVRRRAQRLNERTGEAGDPGEDPTTNGIVRHDSHLRKSGSGPAGWGASSLTTTPPRTPGGGGGGRTRKKAFLLVWLCGDGGLERSYFAITSTTRGLILWRRRRRTRTVRDKGTSVADGGKGREVVILGAQDHKCHSAGAEAWDRGAMLLAAFG